MSRDADKDSFFIGWSADTPRADRRFLLGAGLALLAGGAGVGAALGWQAQPPGGGAWDQGKTVSIQGVLEAQPYPALRTIGADGRLQTVFLATSGKLNVTPPPHLVGKWTEVSGTLIERGRNKMLAVNAFAADRSTAGGEPPGLRDWPVRDLGEAMLTGEILDAKCWFGAMRPGEGKVHKSCAALCANGRLPLAFCATSMCSDATEAPLLLTAAGQAHGPEIAPFVADPVAVVGRLVQVGDVRELRVDRAGIRRL